MGHKILPPVAISFFVHNFYLNTTRDTIFLCASEEIAKRSYKQLLFFQETEILYLPSIDILPYDHSSPSPDILSHRSTIFSNISARKSGKKILVTHAVNLLSKLPPPDLFANSSLLLHPTMKLTTQKLSDFLVQNGFTRGASAIDSGEFAVKGEIIDVILTNSIGYRINFGWDHIESIREIDPESQISIKECSELMIHPASEIILNSETLSNFKQNYLRNFGVNHTNIPLYEAIVERRKFAGSEHLLPLFYNSLHNIVEYLDNPIIIYDNLSMQSMMEHEHDYNNAYQTKIKLNQHKLDSFYPALPPSQTYFSVSYVSNILKQNGNILTDTTKTDDIHTLDDLATTSFIEKKTVTQKFFEIIQQHSDKIPVIFCPSMSARERVKNIITNHNYQYNEIDTIKEGRSGLINLCITATINQSFYTKEYLFITADILGKKFSTSLPITSQHKLKNILMELDHLNEGELVVHTNHGIGRFLNIEVLDVQGKEHDFLKILYANNDKLYIPIENIELIKKYGGGTVELDRLGSANWQKNKAGIKKRIQEIALQLLEMAAKRKLATTSPIEYDAQQYNEFCDKFPYIETDDQLNAINDARSDLQSGILMDRLICGDVGFGKTEVALRAAFMVASSQGAEESPAQVAIIVPTTILCKQHYSRFLERFQGFGLNIQQLSGLTPHARAKIIKQQIANGGINIIIGTHTLLQRNIKFNNLKLLIIDEEQHFGVGQKEYLKTLKSSIHVLSMSATPIPRTLQMSMTGLKELSIIASPPMDRLEVRVIITPLDPVIIRDALLKEHFRGGRSFYVVPRILDIPEIEKYLQQIVPELKYKIAHGKLSPSHIDEIMSEFYEGQFDILISTTIIESGIDIAEANTMIIHNADMLGLSQLYQLKGRIGRGKVRGYAYLTLPHYKKMATHSLKRLEIIQNSCALGSGFTIASHDMDLRGFGNLIGAQQSGQIKEVGVELYQEMLEEQIAIFKNEPTAPGQNFVPTINICLPVFIPNHYISDSTLKLGIYRRVGNIRDKAEIESFKDEMIDRFGPLPIEFSNLLEIVKIKLLCLQLGIENIDSGEKGLVIKFYKNANMADKIIRFVTKYPTQAKLKSDNKLIFTMKTSEDNMLQKVYNLLHELLVL